MTLPSPQSKAPETLSESPENLATQDFLDFQELDMQAKILSKISDADLQDAPEDINTKAEISAKMYTTQKENLRKLVGEKREIHEEIPNALADKLPELSKVSEFAKADAETETQKEAMNALSIGSVMALVELTEKLPITERKVFFTQLKTNPSVLFSGKGTLGTLTPDEQKSLKIIQKIFTEQNYPENSAGKMVQNSWGTMVEMVMQTMDISDRLDSSALGFFKTMRSSSDMGATIPGVPSAQNTEPFFTTLGKNISDFGTGVKKGGKEFLLGLKDDKTGAAVGIGAVALFGYGIYTLFSGGNSSENSQEGGSWWKKGLALGAISLAGYLGLENMDWLKKFLPDGGDLLEKGKDLYKKGEELIDDGKKLIEDGKEKITEIDEKVEDFWEGEKNAKGERVGGKKEEWAKVLEKEGYSKSAELLRGVTTTQLEIGTVAGGVTALLIFRKLFLGGLMKKLFIGKGIPFLGASFVLGKYFLDSPEKGDLTQAEILNASGIMTTLSEKKDKILNIYKKEGFSGEMLDEIEAKFSPGNIWKTLDIESQKLDGLLSENSKNLARGGIGIIGGIVALNIITSALKFVFSKVGMVTSLIAFGVAMGWDISRMQNFMTATGNVYNDLFAAQVRGMDPNLLERFVPNYRFVQRSMHALGLSVFDYKVQPENIEKISTDLQSLNSQYSGENAHDFSTQIEILLESIRIQQEKFPNEAIVLPTKEFSVLFVRAQYLNIPMSVKAVGETFTVELGGREFSGFPYNPLLSVNVEKTPEQIEESRKTKILEGMTQLSADVSTHGAESRAKAGNFPKDAGAKVIQKISEISEKVSKGTSKDFTALDYDELKTLLSVMKAEMVTNNYGEILVTFFDEEGSVVSESTFAGVDPSYSNSDFSQNEELYNINTMKAEGKGYSRFFNKTALSIISTLDEGQGTNPHVKALIEEFKTNPEKIGTPKAWADIFIALARDYKDESSSLGMTLLDTGIVIAASGLVIPFEMGKDFMSSVWDIVTGEFSLDKTLIENPATAVVSVGLVAAGVEKMTKYGKIHTLAKGVRFTSLSLPGSLFRGAYFTGKSGFSLVKESYVAGRVLKSPEVRAKNIMSYGRGFYEHMTPTFRIKSKLVAQLREAQRLQRLIDSSASKADLFDRRSKWLKNLDSLEDEFKLNRIGKEGEDLLKGTRYEGVKFSEIIKQEVNISIKDSKIKSSAHSSSSTHNSSQASGNSTRSHAQKWSADAPEGSAPRNPLAPSSNPNSTGSSARSANNPGFRLKAKKWAGVAAVIGGTAAAASTAKEKWGDGGKDIFDEASSVAVPQNAENSPTQSDSKNERARSSTQVSSSSEMREDEKKNELKLATEKLSALFENIKNSRPKFSDTFSDNTGFSSFTEEKKIYTQHVHTFIHNYERLVQKFPEYKYLFPLKNGEKKTVFSLEMKGSEKKLPVIHVENTNGEISLHAPSKNDLLTTFLDEMEASEKLWMMIFRILPGTGDALDFKDAYRYFERGNVVEGIKSTTFGTLGAALTIGGFFTFGGTAAINMGARIARVTPKIMRLSQRASPQIIKKIITSIEKLPASMQKIPALQFLLQKLKGQMLNISQNVGQVGFQIYDSLSRLDKVRTVI